MSPEPRRRRFSVSQVSTLSSGFLADVETYVSAGVDGIGIWELKLTGSGDGDGEALAALEASGLAATSAVPLVPSILPLPLLGGPTDPRERVDAYLASIRRLAPFRPSALVCLTGSAGGLDAATARRMVVDGLRELSGEAERAGLVIALEPYQREGMESWSIVNTLGEAVELIDEVDSSALGIQFDVWHLWNTPDLLAEIERHCDRIVGVHVCDWRQPTRGWADRVLPGDGVADVPGIIGAVDRTGWSGCYDLEIFSDDGTFGTEYPDSLWHVPARELVARARAAFERMWQVAGVA
jgi:sugar phosphate isomerase/epimerase